MPKRKINGVSQVKILNDFEDKIKKMKKLKKFDNNKFKEACEAFKKDIYGVTDNMNSIATRLAAANTAVRKVLGSEKYDVSIEILKPEQAEKKKQMAERKEIEMSRLANRIQIDYNNYINAIRTYKDSDKYEELVVCACLASGRRMTEICKTGIFTETKDVHYATFSGQLKKKDSTHKPYDIPLIELESTELIAVVAKLRKIKDLSKKSNKDVANITNKSPNDLLKVVLGDKVVSEVVRGAYAFICYRTYGNPSISEDLYGSRILGHSESDINTFAKNYAKVYVSMNDYSAISTINLKLEKVISVQKKHDEMLKKILKLLSK